MLERRFCSVKGTEFSSKQLLSLQRLSIFTAMLPVGYLLINLVPWYSVIIAGSSTMGDGADQDIDAFKTVALQVLTATAAN